MSAGQSYGLAVRAHGQVMARGSPVGGGATVPGGVNSGTAYTYANTYNYTPLPPELRISANPGAISTFTTP